MLENFCPLIFLAVAISIDGFSVGVTYGLKRIKIGFISLLIICSISTVSIFLTCSFGVAIATLITKKLAEIIGGIILLFIGGWLVYSTYFNYNGNVKRKEKDQEIKDKLLLSIQIKSLGIIINILKEPVRADFDNSGSINMIEAFFLGLALALDALGAGLGAGLSGFSSRLVPVYIGITNIIFVYSGYLIGKKTGNKLPERIGILPGFIIIALGFIKLIG